jgi:hypothetical protein
VSFLAEESQMDDRAERLRKCGTGMSLIFYGLCLVVVAVGVSFVGGMLSAAGMAMNRPPQMGGVGRPPAFGRGNPFDPDEQARVMKAMAQSAGPFIVVLVVGGLLALGGQILNLVGRAFCLAVPSDCPGAPILYVSVALVVIAMLHSAYNLGSTFGVLPREPQLLPIVMMPVGLASQILFMVFLQQLAQYIRRPRLADRALWILKWSIIVGVLFVVFFVGSFVGAAIVGPVAMLLGCGLIPVACFILFLLVRYAILLFEMKTALYARAEALGASGADYDQVEVLD